MRPPEAGAGPGAPRAEPALRVALAQAGDRDALDRLLRDHQAPLYRHVRAITGDNELAMDVLQESLFLIARRLGGLRDPRWFRAWAYRIATREAVRAARREKRRSGLHDEIALDNAVETPPPDEAARAILHDCAERLAELPPACQIAVRLHYLEGMTLAEIGEALEIPVGTVKSRIAYGLARLRFLVAAG